MKDTFNRFINIIKDSRDEIEEKVIAYIKIIDDLGGSIQAIKSGYFQNEISQNAYESQKAIENSDDIVVGVNKFQGEAGEIPDTLKIDDQMVARQLERLKRVKEQRDSNQVSESLSKLENAAQSNDNLMPFIIHCVETYVTLGEISDCLRGVFGEHHEA